MQTDPHENEIFDINLVMNIKELLHQTPLEPLTAILNNFIEIQQGYQ